MSERDRKDNDLVRRLIGRQRHRPSLIGPSTASGNAPEHHDSWDNPMTGPGQMVVGGLGGQAQAITGTEGQVPTVQADGTTIFADQSGSGGGRYRALVYELDGAGSFEFLTDLDGHPLYELVELEA